MFSEVYNDLQDYENNKYVQLVRNSSSEKEYAKIRSASTGTSRGKQVNFNALQYFKNLVFHTKY